MTINLDTTENKASQDTRELEKLLKLLKNTEINVVLEIGIFQGYGLLNWRKAFNPYILLGIENDMTHVKGTTLQMADAEVIIEDSHSMSAYMQVKHRLKRDKIDLLFIDGDHSYEGVKKDYKMYSKLVRKGGAIVIHDVIQGEPEVKKFWHGISEVESNLSTISEGGTGYGVIFKQ